MKDGSSLKEFYVQRHIKEHMRMLAAQSLLYNFIEQEKECFEVDDDAFFELLDVGECISINVAQDPKFTQDNVHRIESFKDPVTPVLIDVADIDQTWGSIYLRELDQFQKAGIKANSLKLYKIRKPNAIKFIFSE
jgi:hypothetical protein